MLVATITVPDFVRCEHLKDVFCGLADIFGSDDDMINAWAVLTHPAVLVSLARRSPRFASQRRKERK